MSPSSQAPPPEESGEDQHPSKKRKLSRSRTACLPCRSRKSKCGAHPPDPCPNCIEAKVQCIWPSLDGRSSTARMQKAHQAFLSQHPEIASGLAHGGMSMASGGSGVNDGWLSNFLANGQISKGIDEHQPREILDTINQPTMDPSSFSVLFNTLHPPEDHSFVPGAIGGKIPGSVYGQASSSSGQELESSFDPAQFIWAVSSQLPQVEDVSPQDGRIASDGPSPSIGEAGFSEGRQDGAEGSKLVKITWWRPHGATAIAPGLKKITLKVRVAEPPPLAQWGTPRTTTGEFTRQVIDHNGRPTPSIMRHLLDIFFIHFGCQFPFLDKSELENQVDSGTGSAFLFNAIAGISARFSSHPSIAVSELQPHAYGNVFNDRAKVLLGSMLGVPSRETITAFILMSYISFANDSESDLWMHTGCAVRMAYDLGLHLESEAEGPSEESRLNRLVFWSVLIMDHALAFGVGRQTTFRLEEITQSLPSPDDVHPNGPGHPPSAFPYAAKQMMIYGPLINMLNSSHDDSVDVESDIQSARASAMIEYNQLPECMQWNVGNLQNHNRANQSPIFLQLHLWMHMILSSAFLTGTELRQRSRPGILGGKSGAATPSSVTSLWRNSARTIGDILVLSDIINSYSYLALPFVNQAFYVAGCCYVKEIEQQTPASSPKPTSLTPCPDSPPPRDRRQLALSLALLTSVATNNISTLQQGLAKMTTYWSGVAWVAGALSQRIQGIKAQDVDLVNVTETLGSYVSLPDAGSVPRKSERGRGEVGLTPGTWSSLMSSDMDFLSLPFELGSVEGGDQEVTEQDVSLRSLGAQWF